LPSQLIRKSGVILTLLLLLLLLLCRGDLASFQTIRVTDQTLLTYYFAKNFRIIRQISSTAVCCIKIHSPRRILSSLNCLFEIIPVVNNIAGTYIDCVLFMIIFIVIIINIIIIILVTLLATFLLGGLHLSQISGRNMFSQGEEFHPIP